LRQSAGEVLDGARLWSSRKPAGSDLAYRH
jgi:hypothetical protein